MTSSKLSRGKLSWVPTGGVDVFAPVGTCAVSWLPRGSSLCKLFGYVEVFEQQPYWRQPRVLPV